MLGAKQLRGCRIRRFWHVRAAQVLAGQDASQSKVSTGVKASTEAKCGQVYSLSLRKSRSAHGQMGYILLPFCNCGRVGSLLCYSVVYSVSADYRGERGRSVRIMIAAVYWGTIHRQTATRHKGRKK